MTYAHAFPWAYFKTLQMWLDEYEREPTIKNLNGLHLASSILHARLSTYTMEQNAGGVASWADGLRRDIDK